VAHDVALYAYVCDDDFMMNEWLGLLVTFFGFSASSHWPALLLDFAK